jgi:hypothetical protein
MEHPIEKTPKRRGPKPGLNRREYPIFADRVKAIVYMRDKGITFTQIAQLIGGTRMGVCLQFHRWKHWVRAQPRAWKKPPDDSTLSPQ